MALKKGQKKYDEKNMLCLTTKVRKAILLLTLTTPTPSANSIKSDPAGLGEKSGIRKIMGFKPGIGICLGTFVAILPD